jgi:hypothetical protein
MWSDALRGHATAGSDNNDNNNNNKGEDKEVEDR